MIMSSLLFNQLKPKFQMGMPALLKKEERTQSNFSSNIKKGLTPKRKTSILLAPRGELNHIY